MSMTSGLYRLGADAVIKETPTGKKVCELSLAYSYSTGKKDNSGNHETETGWISTSLWDERAVGTQPYLKKGTQIWACIGDLHIDTYTNSQGVPSSKLVGRLVDFKFAGNKKTETSTDASQQT